MLYFSDETRPTGATKLLSQQRLRDAVGSWTAHSWAVAVLVSLLVALDIHLIISSLALGGLNSCQENCTSVIGSNFARVLGIPLAIFGLGAHLALALAYRYKSMPVGRIALVGLIGAMVGAAAYLVMIQGFVIESWCIWCNTAHLLGLALAIIIILAVRLTQRELIAGSLAGVFAVLCMFTLADAPDSKTATTQMVATSHLVRRMNSDELSLLNGEFTFETKSLPRIGHLDAEQEVVVLMNYACPHCLKLIKQLREVVSELSAKDVAVFFVPVATNPTMAEAQSAMLALWAANPTLHDQVVDSLLSGSIKLTAEGIQKKAGEFASPELLKQWFAPENLSLARHRITEHGRLAVRSKESRGLKGFPQMWFPQAAELGVSEDSGAYFQAMARHLGIQRTQEPQLVITPSEIQFGRTPAAGSLSRTIEISNPGTSVLKLTDAPLPHGWRAETKLPLEIQPKQTLSWTVEVLSPNLPGEWQSELQFLSNAATAQAKVTFKGESVTALKQTERIELRDIPEGTVSTVENKPLEVTPGFVLGALDLKMDGFTARWANAEKTAIAFQQTTLLPVGGYLGTLHVPVSWTGTSEPWKIPALELPVSAHVRSPVIVTPLRVVLPPVILEQPQQYTISMRPRDASKALHPSVELPASLLEAGVTATISPADERNALEVVLHIPARFASTTHTGSAVVLKSGLSPNSEFRLPFELSGQRLRPALAQRTPR